MVGEILSQFGLKHKASFTIYGLLCPFLRMYVCICMSDITVSSLVG